jgi:hypothetical protein
VRADRPVALRQYIRDFLKDRTAATVQGAGGFSRFFLKLVLENDAGGLVDQQRLILSWRAPRSCRARLGLQVVREE